MANECWEETRKIFLSNNNRSNFTEPLIRQLSILNRLASKLATPIRLAASAFARRKLLQMRRLGSQACGLLPYASLRVASAPSSLAIYPFENAPYSVAFIEESSTFSISHFANARDKSGVASPRFPGRYITSEQKNKTPYHKIRSFIFLTGSYLSSQAASSQVLSTYKGLTTVFGMGTGGSP